MPERIAIREAPAFGKVVYDRCHALGLSAADLAGSADMTTDEIECSEEGGTDRRTRPPPRSVGTPRSPSGSATRRDTRSRVGLAGSSELVRLAGKQRRGCRWPT